MPSWPRVPERRTACALAARTLAWALLFAGWLVLGALGARHAPLAAGALAPVALCLLTLGLASRAGASWWPSPRALQAVLAGSAALAALSLAALMHGLPQAVFILDEGDASMRVTILTKSNARCDRDLGLIEQQFAERERAHILVFLRQLRPDEHAG